MLDPYEYTIVVRKLSNEDEEYFRATVKELPDVEVFGDSSSEVYDLAIVTIKGLSALSAELGKPFPLPIEEVESSHSGRVTLRMPKSLHEKIAIQSEEERTSINQYILTAVAHYAGEIAISNKLKRDMKVFANEMIENNKREINRELFSISRRSVKAESDMTEVNPEFSNPLSSDLSTFSKVMQ